VEAGGGSAYHCRLLVDGYEKGKISAVLMSWWGTRQNPQQAEHLFLPARYVHQPPRRFFGVLVPSVVSHDGLTYKVNRYRVARCMTR
jgi:hypothetical protein